jgi:hypothetical protein
MAIRARLYDYLGAASILTAFVSLLVGRVLNYQLRTVPGTFLERVAIKADVWEAAHVWLLIGSVALIPASLALRRLLRARSPWLVDIATAIAVIGGALTVGQMALDFAMLAAAQGTPPAQDVVDRLRAMPIVDWAFYKLPNSAMFAHVLFVVALWREGRGWRLAAGLVTIGILALAVGSLLGPIGERIAFGVATLGYVIVAWKLAVTGMPTDIAENGLPR